jgi:hypothetical protein
MTIFCKNKHRRVLKKYKNIFENQNGFILKKKSKYKSEKIEGRKGQAPQIPSMFKKPEKLELKEVVGGN